MMGKLHLDLFCQDKYLRNHVDLKIKLRRSRDVVGEYILTCHVGSTPHYTITCPVCGQYFNRRENMLRHRALHERPKVMKRPPLLRKLFHTFVTHVLLKWYNRNIRYVWVKKFNIILFLFWDLIVSFVCAMHIFSGMAPSLVCVFLVSCI
jgi:hypothetical protein